MLIKVGYMIIVVLLMLKLITQENIVNNVIYMQCMGD
jgi:hypothetical protein